MGTYEYMFRQNSFNGNFPLFAIETILLSKRLDQCIKAASVFWPEDPKTKTKIDMPKRHIKKLLQKKYKNKSKFFKTKGEKSPEDGRIKTLKKSQNKKSTKTSHIK